MMIKEICGIVSLISCGVSGVAYIGWVVASLFNSPYAEAQKYAETIMKIAFRVAMTASVIGLIMVFLWGWLND